MKCSQKVIDIYSRFEYDKSDLNNCILNIIPNYSIFECQGMVVDLYARGFVTYHTANVSCANTMPSNLL